MAPKKPIKTQAKPEVKSQPKAEQRKQKPARSSDEPGFFKKIVLFLKDERTRFIVGIGILLVVLFLLISFVSYFFTGANDQSMMELSWSELQQMRDEIQNWASVTGAVISENFINRWFGVSSFAILYFALVVGLKLIKVHINSLTKAFFHSTFLLIWVSVTLGFIISPFYDKFVFTFSPGGNYGDEVSKWLISYIGTPGTLMLLIGAFLFYAILSSKRTIPFLKGLFTSKAKRNAEINTEIIEEDESEEVTVAVGTEIIPEDWVVKGNEETEELTIETEIPQKDEVPLEIEPPVAIEENKAVDEVKIEFTDSEHEDPIYNVTKLGKYDPTLDLSHYKPPTLDLLKVYGTDNDTQIDMVEQNANKNRIISTLQNYGIEIDSIKATVGPTITLYEIVPKAGVRISKIRNLEYDIMLSLAATGIRIIAPIPGKGTIGIEVPNSDPQVVSMHSIIASKKFQESKFELPVAFGRTITNEIFMVDLAKMPHLLVAGATGQGKSVGLNAIIASLLYCKHPAELKFVMVDPKKVELSLFSRIERHYLAKLPDSEEAIITDTRKVVRTLNSLSIEMDNRYELLKDAQVRNIKEYNVKFKSRKLNPMHGHRFLPYIVLVVDEFADLIMTAGKEIESPITRLAQLARAVGIHLIIATQRPSVNIITGTIKANFPARIAFRVISGTDSRTILDTKGADQLIGRGDMLLSTGSDLVRLQCAFIDTPEVERLTEFIGSQRGYPDAYHLPEFAEEQDEAGDVFDATERDELFEDAARIIVQTQQGSTSLLQRKLKLGYNRAGRIIDQLEAAGIVGPFEGSKAREVKVANEMALEQFLKDLDMPNIE